MLWSRELQKSFGSFAKRTGDPFYNLRGCWIKQIVRFYSMNKEWEQHEFPFFLLKKKQNGGRHCSWSVKRFNNEIKRTRTAFSDNL